MAQKKKRIKGGDPLVMPISDWGEADDIIRRIGNLQAQIRQCEDSTQQGIDELKAGMQEVVKPIQDTIDGYLRSLAASCAANRAAFKTNRSRKLTFGVVGWRKSTSISVKKTTLELIKGRLTPALRNACIKVKETVDKNALAELTDESLALVSARRTEKDVFFVEPAFPQAAEYPAKK